MEGTGTEPELMCLDKICKRIKIAARLCALWHAGYGRVARELEERKIFRRRGYGGKGTVL